MPDSPISPTDFTDSAPATSPVPSQVDDASPNSADKGQIGLFWRWCKSGWGTISTLGLYVLGKPFLGNFWHRIADIDTLHSIWEWAGGDMPTLIWLTTNPFFGIGLIVFGLIGLPAVVRADIHNKLNPVWLILGWGSFSVIATVSLATLLFDQYSRSSGVRAAMIFYEEQHKQRHFSASQTNSFIGLCKERVNNLPEFIYVYSSPDNESARLALELSEIIRKCGVKAYTPPGGVQIPGEHGLMVEMPDPGKPSPHASTFMDILRDAKINFDTFKWNDAEPQTGRFY